MSDPSFDLTTQPWIRVRLLDGSLAELSLRDLFARAHEVTMIAGELPTQDVAVLRLLLAILRRSLPGERGTAAWGRLWRRGHLDPTQIEEYLDRWADRFDLLHPVAPFYQVASLQPPKSGTKGIANLIADQPREGRGLFTTRTGAALDTMGFAESARWLLHLHAFDSGGTKSVAAGPNRSRSARIAWCGGLGMVVIQGETLFHTLLLNLPIASKDSDPSRDAAAWEAGLVEDEQGAVPRGPVDVLTWQSRTVRLVHEGDRVMRCIVGPGRPLTLDNRHHVEFMTNWSRRSEKTGGLVLRPRTHLPGRTIWRGLPALLAEVGDDSLHPGRWRQWLSSLREDEQLGAGQLVGLRIVGVQFDSNGGSIQEGFDDGLALEADVVASPVLRALAVSAVGDADRGARSLGDLAKELAEAGGASGDIPGARQSIAREAGYAALDHPYRMWLRSLTADTDIDEARLAWRRTVTRHVRTLARELVDGATPAAVTGREVSRGSGPSAKTVYLDAAIAERRFQKQIRVSFPDLYAPQKGAAE
ncbi:type I-E CRISPR-associated protein Cse1/CasA [Nocardioides sp. NPDC101246]|uniref:type I-E CRISPR-associated protein Cse1/CasA n=1 Tax=Nocardioides sp. NPDC101246 TaxID=3364336 RepID=UPI0037FB4CA0